MDSSDVCIKIAEMCWQRTCGAARYLLADLRDTDTQLMVQCTFCKAHLQSTHPSKWVHPAHCIQITACVIVHIEQLTSVCTTALTNRALMQSFRIKGISNLRYVHAVRDHNLWCSLQSTCYFLMNCCRIPFYLCPLSYNLPHLLLPQLVMTVIYQTQSSNNSQRMSVKLLDLAVGYIWRW